MGDGPIPHAHPPAYMDPIAECIFDTLVLLVLATLLWLDLRGTRPEPKPLSLGRRPLDLGNGYVRTTDSPLRAVARRLHE